MSATEITLNELLASRDRRQAMQQKLLQLYPASALVVLTIVMPGAQKQTYAAAVVAEAACRELQRTFNGYIQHSLLRDMRTGFEMYLCVDMSCDEAKRRTISIEETHPLGRLMDIDIIDATGVPLSRGSQRKCLLCGRPARECMRQQSHSQQELLLYINRITDEYIQRP